MRTGESDVESERSCGSTLSTCHHQLCHNSHHILYQDRLRRILMHTHNRHFRTNDVTFAHPATHSGFPAPHTCTVPTRRRRVCLTGAAPSAARGSVFMSMTRLVARAGGAAAGEAGSSSSELLEPGPRGACLRCTSRVASPASARDVKIEVLQGHVRCGKGRMRCRGKHGTPSPQGLRAAQRAATPLTWRIWGCAPADRRLVANGSSPCG